MLTYVCTCLTFVGNFFIGQSIIVSYSIACLRIRATIRSSARMSSEKRLIIITRSSSNVSGPDRLSRCDRRLDRGQINSQPVPICARLRIVANRVICGGSFRSKRHYFTSFRTLNRLIGS